MRTEAPNYRSYIDGLIESGELSKHSKRKYVRDAEQLLFIVDKEEEEPITEKDLLKFRRCVKEKRGITDNGVSRRFTRLGLYLERVNHSHGPDRIRKRIAAEHR